MLEAHFDRARREIAAALSEGRGPRSLVRSIPFETASHKLWLPVRVNGAGPFWFIADTGNPGSTALSEETARQVGLAGPGPVADLDVGGVPQPGTPVRILATGPFEPYDGRRSDGILGADFNQRFVLEIDYAGRFLHLHDAGSFRYGGRGREVPFELRGGFIMPRFRIGRAGGREIDARLVVDTGVM